MKLSIAFFCVLVVVLIGLRFQVNSAATQTPSIQEIHNTSGVPVSISNPSHQDLSNSIVATGNLKEEKRIVAAFQISGRLKSLHFDIGDTIKKGDLIAELVKESQEAAVAQARANLAIAQANLNKANTGARPQELESARAAVSGANAAVKFAKEELVRIRGLVKKEAAPQRQLDQANNAYENAISAKKQADKRLELLTEGTRKEDLVAARGQVMLAKASLESAEIELNKHSLHSPLSGIVAKAPVEPGDVIMTMPSPQTIVEIIKVDPILFECEISELFLKYLSPSTTASIRIDAYPGEVYEGTFYELVPEGNLSNRTFTVRFAVKNPNGHLKPGLFGRSTIALTKLGTVLTVPRQVLRDPDSIESFDGSQVSFSVLPGSDVMTSSEKSKDIKAIIIIENGLSTARLVRTGLIVGDKVEIKSGLTPEDVIVTEGFAEMKTGRKVNTGINTPQTSAK